MNIILTESQYIKLLKENKENEIEEIFSSSRNVTKNIISDIKKKHGIDFTFALTWGSVIGGFIGPISSYMNGLYPNLSQSDINLICFGIILTFFSDNKEKLKKTLDLIKKEGIITFFDRALNKAYDLKEAFFGFLESLNITFSKISNMMAYTFLVPLVPLLKNLAELDLSGDQIELITKGIIHYTGIITSSTLISEMVKKMIARFKS